MFGSTTSSVTDCCAVYVRELRQVLRDDAKPRASSGPRARGVTSSSPRSLPPTRVPSGGAALYPAIAPQLRKFFFDEELLRWNEYGNSRDLAHDLDRLGAEPFVLAAPALDARGASTEQVVRIPISGQLRPLRSAVRAVPGTDRPRFRV